MKQTAQFDLKEIERKLYSVSARKSNFVKANQFFNGNQLLADALKQRLDAAQRQDVSRQKIKFFAYVC